MEMAVFSKSLLFLISENMKTREQKHKNHNQVRFLSRIDQFTADLQVHNMFRGVPREGRTKNHAELWPQFSSRMHR